MSKRQISKPANNRKIAPVHSSQTTKAESDREQFLQLQRDHLEMASRDGTRTTMKLSVPRQTEQAGKK